MIIQYITTQSKNGNHKTYIHKAYKQRTILGIPLPLWTELATYKFGNLHSVTVYMNEHYLSKHIPIKWVFKWPDQD